MTILFQDFYDTTDDLSSHSPNVGGSYALFWSDTSPDSFLSDFVVDGGNGGLQAPSSTPGPQPAVQFTIGMADVVGTNFSVELQFGIEKLVNDNQFANVRVSLFESAALGSYDFSTAFPAITLQAVQNGATFVHTVSAFNISPTGDVVNFNPVYDGYGPSFYPTGGVHTLRLDVTPTETVFRLDDVVVGRAAAEVSQVLDTIYVNTGVSVVANRRLFVPRLQVATGADAGRFWTNRVRTAEIAN